MVVDERTTAHVDSSDCNKFDQFLAGAAAEYRRLAAENKRLQNGDCHGMVISTSAEDEETKQPVTSEPLLASAAGHINPGKDAASPFVLSVASPHGEYMVSSQWSLGSPSSPQVAAHTVGAMRETWEIPFDSPLARISLERSVASEGSFKALTRSSNGYKRSTSRVLAGRAADDDRPLKWYDPQRLVIRPHSNTKYLWDVIMCTFLAYDIAVIPMHVFDLPASTALDAIDYTSLGFWTVSIPLTFFVGYNAGTHIEMALPKTAKHYLSTSFLLDLIIVLFEWMSLSGFGIFRMVKGAKMLRLMKMLRLPRLLKPLAQIEVMDSVLASEITMVGVKIGKLVALILIINHFLACGWWGVGIIDAPNGQRWVQSLVEDDATLIYRYSTCFHWALSQFTPSSCEVVPRNAYERIYGVIVLVGALALLSSVLSSITALMTYLRTTRASQTEEDDRVSRYLAQKGIATDLTSVIQYALVKSRRVARKTNLVESDLKSLNGLPDHLRKRLHWEIYRPVVFPHPMFHNMTTTDMFGLSEVCHLGMTERLHPRGDVVFDYGNDGKYMYFIHSGAFEYHAKLASNGSLGSGESTETDPEWLTEAQWLCEMVLWMHWLHCGSLVGQKLGSVFDLDVAVFEKHVPKHRRLFLVCARYASIYVSRLLQHAENGDSSVQPMMHASVTDLWGTADEIRDMVFDANSQPLEILPTPTGDRPANQIVYQNFFPHTPNQQAQVTEEVKVVEAP